MEINVNGKPVEITGETILPCPKCHSRHLWVDVEVKGGALYCPKCDANYALLVAARRLNQALFEEGRFDVAPAVTDAVLALRDAIANVEVK